MAAASGTTGDIKNNLMKLLREIQRMKLRVEPDIQGLSLGAPSALLPILHQSLMHYSLPLASWLSKHDYELYGKNDLRFVEGVYKVLREVFHYHPRLTKEKFLTVGYAERKLLLVTDLLRGCQTKHNSLTQSHRTRGGRVRTRGGPRTHGSVNVPSTRSEVLTVQTTSGISSAWTEPLVTRVEGPQNEEMTLSSSPEHTTPPHPFTPSRMLELTPSPPPLLPSQSSPVSHKSQPIIIRHDIRQREPVEVQLRTHPQSKFTPEIGKVVEELVIENLSSVSLSSTEGGSGENREKDERETRQYGHTEDPHGQEDGSGHDGSGPPEQQEDSPPSEQVMLSEVNDRVQQLTGMMEKMSARFILLETQLKTTQGTTVGMKKREKKEEVCEKSADIPAGEDSRSSGDSKEEENTSSHSKRNDTQPDTITPPVSKAVNTVMVPSKTTTSDMTVLTARSALANISNESPLFSSKSDVPLPRNHRYSTPHTRHTHAPTIVNRVGGSGGTLSLQLARIRAEEIQPSPLHTPSHPPHHSHTTPPSNTLTHTPTLNKSSLHFSPSLPDDTTRMIASLRERAQRTKDFLQKANNRL